MLLLWLHSSFCLLHWNAQAIGQLAPSLHCPVCGEISCRQRPLCTAGKNCIRKLELINVITDANGLQWIKNLLGLKGTVCCTGKLSYSLSIWSSCSHLLMCRPNNDKIYQPEGKGKPAWCSQELSVLGDYLVTNKGSRRRLWNAKHCSFIRWISGWNQSHIFIINLTNVFLEDALK